MTDYTLIPFDSRYAKDFAEINKEWITEHFVIEPMDTYQLDNCEETVIAQGGEIFFVLEGDRALATCAILPYKEDGVYELAKMGVRPAAKGKGYGHVLMEACIDWARERKAKQVILHSNTSLTPAISLYKKHGFETIYLGPHPDYERSDIEMRLNLN